MVDSVLCVLFLCVSGSGAPVLQLFRLHPNLADLTAAEHVSLIFPRQILLTSTVTFETFDSTFRQRE